MALLIHGYFLEKITTIVQHSFCFCPCNRPGVNPNLDENSTILDCFKELFSDKIQDESVRFINSFASYKMQINSPCLSSSIFSSWTPINKCDLVKFIDVMVAMGLDKRPSIKNYWSLTDIYRTYQGKTLCFQEIDSRQYTIQCFLLLHLKKAMQKKELNHL